MQKAVCLCRSWLVLLYGNDRKRTLVEMRWIFMFFFGLNYNVQLEVPRLVVKLRREPSVYIIKIPRSEQTHILSDEEVSQWCLRLWFELSQRVQTITGSIVPVSVSSVVNLSLALVCYKQPLNWASSPERCVN